MLAPWFQAAWSFCLAPGGLEGWVAAWTTAISLREANEVRRNTRICLKKRLEVAMFPVFAWTKGLSSFQAMPQNCPLEEVTYFDSYGLTFEDMASPSHVPFQMVPALLLMLTISVASRKDVWDFDVGYQFHASKFSNEFVGAKELGSRVPLSIQLVITFTGRNPGTRHIGEWTAQYALLMRSELGRHVWMVHRRYLLTWCTLEISSSLT